MAQTKHTISDDIHALGDLLGQTLKTHEGEATYELVEQIRTLAKSARTSEQDVQTLRQLIRDLPDEATPQLARAFGQFCIWPILLSLMIRNGSYANSLNQ